MPYGIRLFPSTFEQSPLLTEFVDSLLFVSVTWGLVNLLPIYPLDGGQISREACLAINARDGVRLIAAVVGVGRRGNGRPRTDAVAQSFVALMFGYLAFQSFTMLKFYNGRGRWQ